jgi:hypothetical protein
VFEWCALLMKCFLFLSCKLTSRCLLSLNFSLVPEFLRKRVRVEKFESFNVDNVEEDVTAGDGKERLLDPTQLRQELI